MPAVTSTHLTFYASGRGLKLARPRPRSDGCRAPGGSLPAERSSAVLGGGGGAFVVYHFLCFVRLRDKVAVVTQSYSADSGSSPEGVLLE